MNQILDDALGAFIDVLDQHTLADMAAAQPAPAPRRKPARAICHAASAPASPPPTMWIGSIFDWSVMCWSSGIRLPRSMGLCD